jgi:hypothetical protein
MAVESAKVMFEIYREADYGKKYRAVFFTELDDNTKEKEISRAMAGEHVYDSYIAEKHLAPGKAAILEIVDGLNRGESVDTARIAEALAPFEA